MVEADEEIHKPVQGTAVQARVAQTSVNLHVTKWVPAQQEDQILWTMIEWVTHQKVQGLKHMLGDDSHTEEGMAILQEWKELTLFQGALYHCHTSHGKLEKML